MMFLHVQVTTYETPLDKTSKREAKIVNKSPPVPDHKYPDIWSTYTSTTTKDHKCKDFTPDNDELIPS